MLLVTKAQEVIKRLTLKKKKVSQWPVLTVQE